MLENFETGYEGRFDFPPRSEVPDNTYLLASVPRAGSTHLSHLLWRTACLGAPLEYLNYEPEGPYGFAANSAQLQRDLWVSVLRRRCSPNGVFGLKAFPQQLEMLQRRNPSLLSEVLALILPRNGPRRVIYLRRRDRLAQTVSYARASISGIWRQDQEDIDAQGPEYSEPALEAAERGIVLQESVWEKMFEDLRIDPLNLWHEDILQNPAAAAQQAADYLGVTIDPNATIDVPAVSKQSPGDAAEWVQRYSKDRTQTGG
jgi:LPS sulfotransferase NodH